MVTPRGGNEYKNSSSSRMKTEQTLKLAQCVIFFTKVAGNRPELVVR